MTDLIKEYDRIFANDDNGQLVAEITFPVTDGVAVINHTFVDSSLRGQGIAGKLVAAAAEQIRESGLRFIPTCSYAVGWFARHPEYDDIRAGE